MNRGTAQLEGCDWEMVHGVEERPIRVLYVDDDPEFAGVVAHQLEMSGNVAVDTATSGPAGLAAVDETVDCVVCGYEGVTLNGIEFLRAIRKRHPTLPFVLVAAAGTESVAAEAAAAGVTEYVPGGFGSEEYQGLVDRIKRAVETERDDRQIERLQRRLRKLVAHSTDVITVLDRTGTIAFQSPSVERVLGFEPGQMVGESAFEFVHPDDRMAVVEAFDRGVEQPDELVELEWRARTDDGEWCWLHSVGTNRLDDPDVNGFVVNIRDVSDERRRQRRLDDQRERMHRLVERLRALRGSLETSKAALEPAVDADGSGLEDHEAVRHRLPTTLETAIGTAQAGVRVGDPPAVSLSTVARSAWRSLQGNEWIRTEGKTLEVTDGAILHADEERIEALFEAAFRHLLQRRTRRSRTEDDCESVRSVQIGTTAEGFYVAGGSPSDRDLPSVSGIASAHGWSVERSAGADGTARIDIVGVEWAGES